MSRVPSKRSVTDEYYLAYRDLSNLGFARGSRAALVVAPNDTTQSFFPVVARINTLRLKSPMKIWFSNGPNSPPVRSIVKPEMERPMRM